VWGNEVLTARNQEAYGDDWMVAAHAALYCAIRDRKDSNFNFHQYERRIR